MKVVNTFREAYAVLQDHCGPWLHQQPGQRGELPHYKPSLVDMTRPVPLIGIDIGKQFGTRIIMHITPETARKLLLELEKRDLPCPQVIDLGTKILIGVDPE